MRNFLIVEALGESLNLGGAEDFDEFGKNVLVKFSKIE